MAGDFSKSFQVYFDDCDPGGILFFGNYFKVAHRLFENFIVANGISWQEWFGCQTLLVPLKTAKAEYLAPLFGGHSYKGSVRITRIGNSSITVETLFYDLQDQCCSRIETVHVFVDSTNKMKMQIPEEIRQRLS